MDNQFHIFCNKNQDGKISLNNYMFKNFLEENHFFKNYPNEGSTFNFIKKDGIFLKIVYENDIKDFVLNFIEESTFPEMVAVYNHVTGNLKYFQRNYLSLLCSKEIKTMKDSAEICYLFYKNGVLKIDKQGKELLPYESIDLCVWEGQIIKRDYLQSDHHDCEYRTFIWNISGQNRAKYKAFQTVIGYLMHSYKTNSNNKAIIFNDEIISENPNGRSGKGLFWNALKNLKKVQDLDGKLFDFGKSFPYQSVSTDCQILVFDDVKKNFQFESLFSVITEGISIEYKGKDAIKLPVTESPKIIITTNYTIQGDSASFNARKYEVEMSSHYNEKYTPKDEFKHELFTDWDDKEWAKFDSYMAECVSIYLRLGLVEMPTVNLEYRKITNEIGSECFNFFENVGRNEWLKTKELFDEFLINYPEKKKFFTQNKLTSNFKKYAKFKGLESQSAVSGGVSKLMIIDESIDHSKTDLPF